MRGATVFGFIEPASYMLVHERLHLQRPGLDAGAGGLAVLQGDDELGGAGGLARARFVFA